MTSGKDEQRKLDPLTDWELTAINILIALHPKADLDVKASKQNMLKFIEALDRGELDTVLGDPAFMEKTEALLLAMLRGERIDVSDPSTYSAHKEIFAAAQVVYNQAVARGIWELHPEIRAAINQSK